MPSERFREFEPPDPGWRELREDMWINTNTGQIVDLNDSVSPGGNNGTPSGNTGSTGGTSGSTGGGSEFYSDPIVPGFTWNPQNKRPVTPFGEGIGERPDAPTWQQGSMGSPGGPFGTGQREAFKPFGTIQEYASEILRYGGPSGGSGGRWTGIADAKMEGVGGTEYSPDSVEVPDYEPNYRQVSRSGDGSAYQNIVTSDRDGEVWFDPITGQGYVWRNGRFQKADLRDRTGPVVEGPPVENRGGTGTPDDPIDLWIGGGSQFGTTPNGGLPQGALAEILRKGAI